MRRAVPACVLPVAMAFCGLSLLAAREARGDELPIAVQTETLPNGLRVVLSPERATPTVAIAVYYDVGARREERGRSGFAHLFEHMMFQGSANVPKGEHFRLIARHGGDFNGTTSEDRTNYYETLPSNALELGLWLEADRMRSLDVSQVNLDNQRETVLEERRQSYENEPYMLSYLRRDEVAYGDFFPYAHSVIGDVADLRNASLDEVRAFHRTYYAPDNAVLTITGDFDPARAMELVRRHFAAIPRHAPPAYSEPALPAQTAERTDTVRDPLAELPAFHLAYHIPRRRTPDHYALEILSEALGGGRSARLYRQLVREREVASSIEVHTEDRRGPDLFTVWCVASEGHTAQQGRTLVLAAIDDVARNGISGRELQRVKNRVRTSFVLGLQSNLERAQQLSEYELYDGNAALLRTELDRYLAVTLDDVRRVAAQYLVATNRTVIDVVPGAANAPAAGSSGGGGGSGGGGRSDNGAGPSRFHGVVRASWRNGWAR